MKSVIINKINQQIKSASTGIKVNISYLHYYKNRLL
jgi:hypothetical protein